MGEIEAIVAKAAAVTGLPRKALARRAGIAPETLSRMCSRGTGDFTAVARLAGLAGIDLTGSGVAEPRSAYGLPAASDHARLDARSLALHAVIAGKLLANPALVGARVLPNIERFKAIHAGSGTVRLLERWEAAAREGVVPLLRLCVDPSESGKQLRQASPLTGLLLPAERTRIYESFAA